MSCGISIDGEHTRLACSFRRPAENLVPKTKMVLTMVRARRPNPHAGRVCSRIEGLKARQMIAQGNALGNRAQKFQALKGRNKVISFRVMENVRGVCAALAGLDLFLDVKPRALPWATILRPCRAGEFGGAR